MSICATTADIMPNWRDIRNADIIQNWCKIGRIYATTADITCYAQFKNRATKIRSG